MEHLVTLVDGPRDGETTTWPIGDDGSLAETLDHHAEITWAEHPEDPPVHPGLPELTANDPVTVLAGHYRLDDDGAAAQWVELMPLAG